MSKAKTKDAVASVATKEAARVGKTDQRQEVKISPPNVKIGVFTVEGTAPYVQLRFGQKAKDAMAGKQERGGKGAKAKKPPRDFAADYEDATYRTTDGQYGIPATAFRAAMVRACKLTGFAMTDAKVTLFCLADDEDAIDGTPLVYIDGQPEQYLAAVRNATGVADLRMRAMWREWKAIVRIKFNADVFLLEDVANILAHAGEFVGVGEGRPDSKKSAGMGFGTFCIITKEPA